MSYRLRALGFLCRFSSAFANTQPLRFEVDVPASELFGTDDAYGRIRGGYHCAESVHPYYCPATNAWLAPLAPPTQANRCK